MIDKDALFELQNMVFGVAGKLGYMTTMTQHAAGAMTESEEALESTEQMLISIASDMRDGASGFEDVARAMHTIRTKKGELKNEEEPQSTEG